MILKPLEEALRATSLIVLVVKLLKLNLSNSIILR